MAIAPASRVRETAHVLTRINANTLAKAICCHSAPEVKEKLGFATPNQIPAECQRPQSNAATPRCDA